MNSGRQIVPNIKKSWWWAVKFFDQAFLKSKCLLAHPLTRALVMSFPFSRKMIIRLLSSKFFNNLKYSQTILSVKHKKARLNRPLFLFSYFSSAKVFAGVFTLRIKNSLPTSACPKLFLKSSSHQRGSQCCRCSSFLSFFYV